MISRFKVGARDGSLDSTSKLGIMKLIILESLVCTIIVKLVSCQIGSRPTPVAPCDGNSSTICSLHIQFLTYGAVHKQHFLSFLSHEALQLH